MTKYEELKKIICEALPRLKGINGDFLFLHQEPLLSDVLEYLGTIGEDDDFRIYSDGKIQFWDDLYSDYYNAKIDWNLSQPLLKDQSEELIDYLLTIKK